MPSRLKQELLKLLEEDKEFRYAVAGLLGYAEVLDELRKLREDFNKLYQKSLEHDKRFEVLEKKLLEHDKRFEAIERKLLEHDKRFEAIERKLEEHDRRFEELRIEIRDLKLAVDENRKKLSHLALVCGALTESFYARMVLDQIASIARSEGDEIVRWERNARIDEEDIDLLIETNTEDLCC